MPQTGFPSPKVKWYVSEYLNTNCRIVRQKLLSPRLMIRVVLIKKSPKSDYRDSTESSKSID